MNEDGRRRIDEIGEESRRRILDAAEQLFAEKGYERTSFVDIAAVSGISRGSIPWHFKNKDGLIMAVLQRSILRAVSREKYTDKPELPTLGSVLADYAHYLHEGNPRLFFMILTEVMKGDGPLNDEYRDFMRQQRSDLRDWFRVQRPEGVDRAGAGQLETSLSTVVNAALMGLHLQWQVDPDYVDIDQALATLGSLIDRHIDDLWDEIPATKEVPRPRKSKKTG